MRPARRPPLTCLATMALVLGAWALPAAGQSVVGTVIDGATDRPVNGVRIEVRDAGRLVAHAVSNVQGEFLLLIERGGVFALTTDRIGYGVVRADSLAVAPGERVVIEIRLAVEAVALEPLVVTSRVDATGDLAGFYARMDRGQRAGFGHFISLQQIERASAGSTTDLLRMVPGVRVLPARGGSTGIVRMSGNCSPALFIDGIQINRAMANESLDDYVSPFAIEGIEVYRGAAQQVLRFNDPRGCGSILVWTRRGHRTDGEFSWKKLILGLGLVAGILLLR